MVEIDDKGFQLNQKTEYWLLAAILLISFWLNLYGINWGLPSRWNVDQSVTPALNMLKNKSFSPQIYFHPSFYYYFLVLFLAPYLLFQYTFHADFSSFLSKASVSWNYMALSHPDLATGIFIWARLSSVLFSVLTVLVVYRIGKTIHSSGAGLFSALILALTMDFVNWAHMTKIIPPVNLLTLLSIYYVFLVFKEENIRKNYLLCCLFGGLACSVKLNGGITFLLIPIVAFWQFKRNSRVLSKGHFWGILKTILSGIGVYLFAFFLSSPNILLEASRYYTGAVDMYKGRMVPTSFGVISKIWLPNLVGLSTSLIWMFGIPLALLIGCGLFYILLNKYYRRLLAVRIMVFLTVIVTCVFALMPRVYKSPDSKFMIQIVPLLAVFGGIFLNDFLSGKILPNLRQWFKTAGLAVIFVISFFYCLSLDNIFAYDDLRYHATKWIKSNVPAGSNIIVNNPLEYSLGVEILKDYNMYILGDEPGTKGAYGFRGGEYYGIDDNKLQEIKSLDLSYVIRSCWRLRHSCSCSSLDRFTKEMKLVKTFERKKQWFWSPDIGGYEPSQIEIYIINKK